MVAFPATCRPDPRYILTPLPGSGPLYAARVLMGNGKGGALQSVLPVSSALTVVPLPSVRDELVTPGR